MLVYASVCAILLLAGLGEAKKHRRPRAHHTINEITVTNAYSSSPNAADTCFQLKKMPLFLSKENFRAAGKALRQSGHRHAWVFSVRHNGGWVSKRLKLQLPASARKLNNRDLREGERGEVVEETNQDVVHVTLCEEPGSHRRRGYRRQGRSRRHRRHHRRHARRHARRHEDSRDRRSYSLDRRSEDRYARKEDRSGDLSSYDDRRSVSRDRRGSSRSNDRRSRSRRDRRALRRTGGDWADRPSTDSEGYNRRNRREREDDSRENRRSYDRDDRRRSRRDDYSRSDDDYSRRSDDDHSRTEDDYSRSRHRRRHRRSRSSRRAEKAHQATKGISGCPAGYQGDPSKCPIQHLLDQGNPRFITA